MKKPGLFLIIKIDHNDGDYIEKSTSITVEQFEKFRPLIEAIKNFQPYKGEWKSEGFGKAETVHESTHDHNWPVGEYCCRTDMGEKTVGQIYTEAGIAAAVIEEFDDYFVPKGEGNVHTIKSITLMEVSDIKELI